MIENEIQSAIKPILDIYLKMELELIAKIVEHFSMNEEFTNSDYWYLEKLKEFGGLNNETIKLLEKYTGRTRSELLKAMKKIGISSMPIDQLNIAKQRNILLEPNKIMNSVNIQNIIKYSYNELEKTFLNLNKTIQEQVRQTYTDIITETYIKTNAGVCSYQEAILDSLDALGDKGITILTYQDKNGLKRNYDVVGTVRRDLLVATRGLAGKVNEEVIKESGNHIIRVTNHFGARTGDGGENYTNHAWWQEKQFFCWNYDGKATEEEKKLPDFMEHCNYGDVRGIVGINCKHLFTVWYGSIKKEDLGFTYDENEEQYEKTQQQRYLENGVRKWKRKQVIAQKAKNEDGYKKASLKTREWQERLKKFTEENDLRRDYTREHISVTKSKESDIMYPYIRKNVSAGYDTSDEEKTIKDALALLPVRLGEAIEDKIEFEIITKGKTSHDYSRCDAKNQKIYIYQNATKYEVIHEVGHFIEHIALKNNASYLKLKQKLIDDSMLIKINRNGDDEFALYNTKFIGEYQGYIHCNKKIEYAMDKFGKIKPENVTEIFSESFREYFENPQNLKAKLPELYNIIERLIK